MTTLGSVERDVAQRLIASERRELYASARQIADDISTIEDTIRRRLISAEGGDLTIAQDIQATVLRGVANLNLDNLTRRVAEIARLRGMLNG